MCTHPLNEVLYGINTEVEIEYNPSGSDDIVQYFETNVLVNCPLNGSIPDMLLDEMSFDYSNSFGIVQQINLTCELDETWKVSGGPVGETCEGATGEVERCLIPKIPDCVDKNKYCSYPPMLPASGKMQELERPLDDYLTVPGTKMYYYCPTPKWAFNYGYDEVNFVSYHFTKNINNLTITCNDQGTENCLKFKLFVFNCQLFVYITGFWDVDYFVEGETCINPQPNAGGCEKIHIPECVDRNIYCKDIIFTSPENSTKIIVNQPNLNSELVYGTAIDYGCLYNMVFDYMLPDPFISFFYRYAILCFNLLVIFKVMSPYITK